MDYNEKATGATNALVAYFLQKINRKYLTIKQKRCIMNIEIEKGGSRYEDK